MDFLAILMFSQISIKGWSEKKILPQFQQDMIRAGNKMQNNKL